MNGSGHRGIVPAREVSLLFPRRGLAGFCFFLSLLFCLLPPFLCLAEEDDDPAEFSYLCPLVSAPAPALPRSYARVRDTPAPVYARPQDQGVGLPPVRFTGRGFVWVSLAEAEPVMLEGAAWWKINEREYIRADRLEPARPADFCGVFPPAGLVGRFAWMLFASTVVAEPGLLLFAREGQAVIPARSLVLVHEVREVENRLWCRIGEDAWVPHQRLAMVVPRGRPLGVGEDERWLEVNLSEQTLAAYQGDRLVFATLISAGEERFPTARGLYRLWAKAGLAKMSGGEEGDDYYHLEDVPWQMYFHRSYALHASYWHDFFGLANSHGCVNLAPGDAAWLFAWTSPSPGRGNWRKAGPGEPGTRVFVHAEPVAVD